MKKNKNRKIKVNAYYNGMDTINNIVGATSVVGSALSGISDEGSAANTAGNVLSSAGSLAAAGSAFGPIGTGVGAALGAVVGGISAARRRKQLIDKRIRDNYIKSTEIGMNQSAADTEEYWNNNNVAYSFENGGILPDLAYVDNNEILRDDNGNITKVPNNIPGTDNHLIDSSSLDSVLSDNIKRPGTKNTFAKEGEKLVKRMKPSKGKDKFAENTNRLNKLNANKAYEALLAEQEQVKAKKGIKPKTKSLIPAYLDGTEKNKKVVIKDKVTGESSDEYYSGWYDPETGEIYDTTGKFTGDKISKKNTQSKDNKSVYPIDWASLAPTIYNTLQGLKNPEIDPLVTNPYNNQIINSMAKRRMNIDPILSANARSRAISNYNLANLNANTGANLAARTQAAVNEYAANEALYGTKQNADNAYIADYANTLNNLGQQYTSSKATNIDLNARNRAATRSFASKAASQLGEWSQINSKMKNEYNRDMMMWPLLEDFLSQGYTTDKLAQLKRYM